MTSGKVLRSLQIAFAIVAVAVIQARADIIDLGGETVAITTDNGLNTYKNHEVRNGVLNVSAKQGFADGTFTFGAGLVINQTSGAWGTAGSRTVEVVNGATVNFTSGSDIYFGRYNGNTTYNGTTQLILNNGNFNCGKSQLCFWPTANSNGNGKNVVLNMSAVNNSVVTLAADKELRFGEIAQSDSKKHNTIKVTVNIENSAITAKQIRVGQTSNYLTDTANSYNRISFGPGTVLTLNQIYAYAYPAPTVTFDGVTIHYAGTGSNSFIGQNSGLKSDDVYEILSGGLTIDIPSGIPLVVDVNSSVLKGAGGITKTGDGSLTWNSLTSGSTVKRMLFTGPLVVTSGSWSSSLGYAASAFKAEGGNLTLSGALSASDVVLSATDGGTLTLSGANIADASPSLTVDSGGSTDYFSRDGHVSSYALDAFTLGEGASIGLDADAYDIDTISVATTNITATAANPATLNIVFSEQPATGRTFALFATDDAAKFTLNPRMNGIMLPHEKEVVDGVLVMTVTAVVEDYTWNSSQSNWGDPDAWIKDEVYATWTDSNNAYFTTANASAAVTAPVIARKIEFSANGRITGSSTITAAEVSVTPGVSATISAPTAGQLTKTGTGSLTLGANRTDATMLSEGTLAFAAGATVDPEKLVVGMDAEKPVTFDYGGQTLTANPTAYLSSGADVTLTNGVFTYGNDGGTPPTKTLTVAAGATLSMSGRFNWNAKGHELTVNVAGGTVSSAANNNNWLMQASTSGRLNINVTDGGLLEFGGFTRMLTCRDGTAQYQNPSMYVRVVGSTMRAKNNGFCFGYDYEGDAWQNKNPVSPTFVLAMTNSCLDAGTSNVYLGNGQRGTYTDGSYTADFEGCEVRAKEFRVWYDRPLNAARFNNSTLVLTADSNHWLDQQDVESTDVVTVGPGGLVLDSNGHTGVVAANIGGEGIVTKTGSGTLRFATNETSTAAFRVQGGVARLNGGFSLARPTTVAEGATFSVEGTRQTSVANITFEAGATFNVDAPSFDVVPMAVTTMTFPENGEVFITMNGGPFRKGLYKILSKSGITAAEGERFTPVSDEEVHTWSVDGETLILKVGEMAGKAWTGLAGDGKMSTGGNWYGGEAPVDGDELYFTSVREATEILADIPGSPKFGDVLMGEGVITFSGTLAALSFSDTSKIAVAAGATVSLDGDIALDTTSEAAYIVDKVDGEFIVGGRIYGMGSKDVNPTRNASTGIIVAGGISNDQANWVFRLASDNQTMRWAIGQRGITGTHGMWLFANSKVKVDMQPYDCDFEINDWIGVRTSAQGLFLNTTGYTDGLGHTIMANKGFVREGNLYVSGLGALVCNYSKDDIAASYSQPNCEVKFTVREPATLALVPGSDIGTGAVKVESNAALRVERTGTATLYGALTCDDYAKLSFRFTEKNAAPKLVLEKAPTFGLVQIDLSESSENPRRGVYTIMEWPADAEVSQESFLLATPKANWAQRVFVEGNTLKLNVVSIGTMVYMR